MPQLVVTFSFATGGLSPQSYTPREDVELVAVVSNATGWFVTTEAEFNLTSAAAPAQNFISEIPWVCGSDSFSPNLQIPFLAGKTILVGADTSSAGGYVRLYLNEVAWSGFR
jgi:hypothetical protein